MGDKINLKDMRFGTDLLKRGLAKIQEGGVEMDVVTPEEAHVAEDAGAVSVMALERVPADIRASGGVARMSHPTMIKEIILMNGYGPYVWSAFIFTLVSFATLYLVTKLHLLKEQKKFGYHHHICQITS